MESLCDLVLLKASDSVLYQLDLQKKKLDTSDRQGVTVIKHLLVI